MARTAIHVTPLVANSSVAYAAGTNLDASNHMYVPATVGRTDEIFLRVTNTTAAEKAVLVKAGAEPLADASGQGDITVTLGAGDSTPTIALVGPFTSARFLQADGTINVNVCAGMTGTIEVYTVPRSA